MATFVVTAPFLRQSNRLLGCPVSAVEVKILCDIEQMQEKRKKPKLHHAEVCGTWANTFLGTPFPYPCFFYQQMYEWVPLCHM